MSTSHAPTPPATARPCHTPAPHRSPRATPNRATGPIPALRIRSAAEILLEPDTPTPTLPDLPTAEWAKPLPDSSDPADPILTLPAAPLVRRTHVSILAGPPGIGKSLLALDLAARLSRHPDAPGSLIFSCEDVGPELRGRLRSLHANFANIHTVDGPQHDPDDALSIPRDRELLENAIRGIDRCALVIMDPLPSYLGASLTSHARIRRALDTLSQIARATGVVILGITHTRPQTYVALNPRKQRRTPAHALIGALAFTSLPRAIFLVDRATPSGDLDPSPPPSAPLALRLTCHKSNFARHPAPQLVTRATTGFEYSPLPDPPPAPDKEPSFADLEAQANARASHSAFLDALDFLSVELSDGPLPSTEIFKRARNAGHTAMTLRRAKAHLGINVTRLDPGRHSPWPWVLSPRPDSSHPTPCQAAPDSR